MILRAARRWVVGLAIAVAGVSGTSAWGQLPYEGPPIDYLEAPVDDPVARLQRRLDRGEEGLGYDERLGYLPAVLEQLGVSETSQVLVFSKTSFQHTRISPRSPRALYFGDDAYVGWVRDGDVLEISAVDPQQGAVYYLLDQRRSARPTFERQTYDCLSCHASGRTQGVPGHLVRSVFAGPDGQPAYNAGTFVTDHTSPMEERWGGWYVTGTHGDQQHMGNVFVRDRRDPERLDTSAGANVTDLSGRFASSSYLTGHSDIVALMVLEHQTQMHNRITAAGYQARLALHHEAGINEALGRPAGSMSDSTRRRIEGPAEELLRYMLFVGEAELTSPVAGTSGFAEHFASTGRRDRRGRSLRDLDLETRLFRYPCSYLIHSEAFDALPLQVKDHVERRLHEVLTSADQAPEFDHLSPGDRRAILEILRDTRVDPPSG
ncbi:hypothetical protein [Tautonia plasticadhaerens]|uniref:hypothetical protein n=1 Tax=Tautonia plasticadhaerens TaxID=2527974 RepID=UPI001E3467B0|nr:hypothetical protein [Tautonia plasticadhaerens]